MPLSGFTGAFTRGGFTACGVCTLDVSHITATITVANKMARYLEFMVAP